MGWRGEFEKQIMKSKQNKNKMRETKLQIQEGQRTNDATLWYIRLNIVEMGTQEQFIMYC